MLYCFNQLKTEAWYALLLVWIWCRRSRQVMCTGEWHVTCYWTMHQSERQKKWNMEFLKSLVPAIISGEGPTEQDGAIPKETGPRLLRMKRLGLLVMGQTIDEDPVGEMMRVDQGISSSRPARSTRTHLAGTPIQSAYCCSTYLLCFVCVFADYLGHFIGVCTLLYFKLTVWRWNQMWAVCEETHTDACMCPS